MRFPARCLGDGFEVLDGPVHEAARTLAAGDGRHERVGARGQHELVIGKLSALFRTHQLGGPIDGHGLVAEMHRDLMTLIEAGLDQRQILGRLAGEELREVNPIVGQPGFFTERHDLEPRG